MWHANLLSLCNLTTRIVRDPSLTLTQFVQYTVEDRAILQLMKHCPTVRARTSRYKNSFIPYALFNVQ